VPYDIRRIVDLSHPIHDDMPIYPGDPVVRITPAATIAEDGCHVQHVHLGSQTGTHLDAPFHFFDDGAQVDDLALDRLCAPAVIADVRSAPARSAITWSDLAPVAGQLGPRTILVLHTGWSRHWGTDRYHAHPYLDATAAQRILDAGTRTIAIDAMSLDETVESSDHPTGFAAHTAVLGAGGVIAENLTNLAAIDFPDPVLSLLPIRLRGADGAPIRAVAMEIRIRLVS
jgi:kynurenine formamidase